MVTGQGLILALDGGQTGTVALLGTCDGVVVGVGAGGPVRHHEEDGADALAARGVRTAIRAAMADGLVDANAAVTRAVLSMTGSEDAATRTVLELWPECAITTLRSDTLAVLASGTGSDTGIALIAGTGSVALGSTGGGDAVVRGGWGWLMGDQGSGYRIAVDALRAAALAEDGLAAPTVLSEVVPAYFGERDLRAVYNLVTGVRGDRGRIAGLAPSVIGASPVDPVCAAITERAVADLTVLVGKVIDAVRPATECRTVVLGGGILSPDGIMAPRLTAAIEQNYPDFQVITPTVPPVAGAYYLGLLAERGTPVTAEEQDRTARALSGPDRQATKRVLPIPTHKARNSRMNRAERVASLRGAVLVSCQAGPESPLNHPEMIAALAASAERGGARGFRVDGPTNTAAVRAISALPILGINKVFRDGFEVYITATFADALAVVHAGAELVALDGSSRPRPGGESLADIIDALHRRDIPVMADIGTLDEAEYAIAAGADIVATTMAGYTSDTEGTLDMSRPAFELLQQVVQLGAPTVVEGRIWTTGDVRKSFQLGAHAIVIGSAVTVPEFITQRFVAAAKEPNGAAS